MKNIFLIIFSVLSLVLPSIVYGEEIPPIPDDQPGRLEWLKAIVGDVIGKVTDETKRFYGIVTDQYGNPVSGASVEAQWHYLSLTLHQETKVKELQTDASGRFDFVFGPDVTPYVGKIKKKGYEFDIASDVYSQSNEKESLALIAQSVSTPIKFVMRKLGPTTYLYKNEGGGRFSKPNSFVSYDIFRPGFMSIDRDLTKLISPYRRDLIFDVTKATGSYTFKILPVQETGSMLVVDDLLYEAPPDGYLKEVTLTLNVGEKRETYLYFTSRDPAVYSRMEMELIAEEDELVFRFETWTNPYGSRNLEYEPDLPFDLYEKLRKEAEDALKSQKLPPEPDIPAMIASGLYQ